MMFASFTTLPHFAWSALMRSTVRAGDRISVSQPVALMVSTVALSVPRHQRMLEHPTPELGRALVRTNWPRTVAWTAHAVILAAMVFRLV